MAGSSLKDKALKATSLEFTHSQGHIWVTEGVNLIQEPNEKLGNIRQPHHVCPKMAFIRAPEDSSQLSRVVCVCLFVLEAFVLGRRLIFQQVTKKKPSLSHCQVEP